MKRVDYLMAAMLALGAGAVACDQIERRAEPDALHFSPTLGRTVALTACRAEPTALCATDSECAELCPTGTRDLPADHPDYCDGGPQS